MTLWPGGGYFVHIPELPGCYVIVDDLAQIETALQAAMAHAVWSSDALPAPAVMDYERRIEQAVRSRSPETPGQCGQRTGSDTLSTGCPQAA